MELDLTRNAERVILPGHELKGALHVEIPYDWVIRMATEHFYAGSCSS